MWQNVGWTLRYTPYLPPALQRIGWQWSLLCQRQAVRSCVCGSACTWVCVICQSPENRSTAHTVRRPLKTWHTQKGYHESAMADVSRSDGDRTKHSIILHFFCFHLMLSCLPPSLHLFICPTSLSFPLQVAPWSSEISIHERQCDFWRTLALNLFSFLLASLLHSVASSLFSQATYLLIRHLNLLISKCHLTCMVLQIPWDILVVTKQEKKSVIIISTNIFRYMLSANIWGKNCCVATASHLNEK